MSWFRREWETQWPKVRFELYKWGWIVAGGVVIGLGTKLLHGVLRIPDPYFYGSLFVLACACFVFLVNRFVTITKGEAAIAKTSPQIGQGQSTNVGAIVETSSSVEDFYRTYDNRLLTETEQNIRAQADKYPPGVDREKFLVRYFASFVIIGIFEYIWVLIFRSQIVAMEVLNKAPQKIEGLRQFYDAAISLDNAVFYAGYPFTSWLAFMKSNFLIREDGDLISITIRGQEFLKYLIHTNRSADDRRN